jgi:hypothetical protein
MRNPLSQKSWSPYIVGAAIGVLSWFTFATVNHPLGVSTTFENGAALIAHAFVPGFDDSPYWSEKADQGKLPRIDWQALLVVGVLVGAWFSASLSGDRTTEAGPSLWQRRFGSGHAKRFVAAFLGAALMMFGARVAGGCTSGHGISGGMQLAVSSWLFMVLFFVVGIVVAFAMYGKERRANV